MVLRNEKKGDVMVEFRHPEILKLRPIYQRLGRLYGITSLLHWDQETNMPESGIQERAESLAFLYSLINETMSGDSLRQGLLGLVDLKTFELKDRSLSKDEAKFAIQCARHIRFSTCMSPEFMFRYEKHRVFAQLNWAKAREQNRFDLFADDLARNISFAREHAQMINGDRPAYDVLLDMQMEGVTSKWLDQIFAELCIEIKKIVSEWTLLQKPVPSHQNAANSNNVEIPEQPLEKLCKILVQRLGLGPECASLSRSTHPFCAPVHPLDIRMTNRYNDPSFLNAIGGAIHEFGHGLHAHQGNQEWLGSPLGFCSDPAISESQSRFWEIMIGKDPGFLKWLHSLMRDVLGHEAPSLEYLQQESQSIQAGPVRVNENEVNYPFHIVIRHEIEKSLFSGELQVLDIPSAWRELYQKYLGLSHESDRLGCLQDSHWAQGNFAMFPGYQLGTLMAAQLYDHLQVETPDLSQRLEAGDFSRVRGFLQQKIHQYGGLYSMQELVELSTGKPLSCNGFTKLLRSRYL